MKSRLFLYLILASSVAGFILFFPVRIGSQDCCLGDRWNFFYDNHHADMAMHDMTTMREMHSHDLAGRLAHRYFFPFGMIWWTSIAVGYFTLKQLTNLKDEKKR